MQIPVGVQLRNENKLEEMANVLEEFHDKYVPSIPFHNSITLHDGSTRTYDNTQFHNLLVGGDQFTAARARGAITLRLLHSNPVHHLDGITPIVEDWHARMTLVKVVIVL